MRSDMAKVVTERPRRPSWLKYNFEGRRYRWKNDLSEDAPTWEGTGKGRKAAGEYKSFDDHIRPLYRYLDSKIGCRWDDVYGEIAEYLPGNTMAGHHIREQHVKQMVSLHPQYNDGKYGSYVRAYGEAPRDKPIGWKFVEFHYGEFYVDLDGILRRAPKKKYKAPPKEVTKKTVDDHVYEKIGGIWYEVVYQTYTRTVIDGWNSYLLGRKNDGREAPPIVYKTEEYQVLVSKKQLNGKELKKLNLANDKGK